MSNFTATPAISQLAASADLTSDTMTGDTIQVTTDSISPFVGKLWNLVSDPKTDKWIRWDEGGQMFHVSDSTDFAKTVLPDYFKHNNMASFIRQLNMYGFRKVVTIDQRSMHSDSDESTFQHRYFIRDRIDLIQFIKRKLTHAHTHTSDLNQEQVSHLITQVSDIKTKQDDVSDSLETLKQENDTLWRELITLRNQHAKQEKVVNTLIHFLVNIFNPQRAAHGKKQFMIEQGQTSGEENAAVNGSRNAGPVIKDVTNEETPVGITVSRGVSVASPEATITAVPTMSSVSTVSTAIPVVSIPPGITLKPTNAAPSRQISEDLSSHLTNVDGELQVLKELFDGGNMGGHIDEELLAGLFNGEIDLASPTGGGVGNLALTDGSSQTMTSENVGRHSESYQHGHSPVIDFGTGSAFHMLDELPAELFSEQPEASDEPSAKKAKK